MKVISIFVAALLSFGFSACSSDDGALNGSGEQGQHSWLIPENEVFDGGPGQDGIPALTMPDFIPAGEAEYLSGDDLVLGYKDGSDIRAYPHSILNWHEIINDKVHGFAFAVHYCPLTGTGIGWDRTIDGTETTFGVSGLLYNSNLILFDRATETYWSQMRLDAVKGEWAGAEADVFQLVETRWDTWKAMYPETAVVSTDTGYNRDYQRFPYGDYPTNHDFILFPYEPKDDRLDAKERVHGVIVHGEAKAYRLSDFLDDVTIIEDDFMGEDLIIAGNQEADFIVSFYRNLSDGSVLDFSPVQEKDPSVIMEDNEGNLWDVFGEAVSGPREGQRLQATTSFMGYWFAWGAFYSDLVIYDHL